MALIGSGVNYTLPAISGRLARDGEGEIIGLDFVDRDNRPFDVAGPENSADPIRPHGTTLASVLLAEPPRSGASAASIRLVPVRLAPPIQASGEPGQLGTGQLGGAVAFIAATPARVVLVAYTSAAKDDWEAFRQAAMAAPHILFVLPAGDGGQNLDQQPHYPANLGLANAIVVAAAESNGAMPPQSNWGPQTVDLAVPAGRLRGFGIDGAPVQVSGSVYAAALVAGLAARVSKPGSSPASVKAQITKAGSMPPGWDGRQFTRHGVIDPMARATND